MAWEDGHRKVIVETDSLLLVQRMFADSITMGCSNLIHVCRCLTNKERDVRIAHLYREYDHAADFMASEALKFECGLRIVFVPPAGIVEALQQDLVGVAWAHRAPVHNIISM
ncbi:conserved hypothetical protein [Ricinus communis]|uniref:RNase H type-1 domain-containing protein n=1 Tax=Ricinus communis TaxID=3988 RepID=B9SCI0_RICCO|nr:conserved hypothetical protein [Ricinus communis]